MTGLPAGAVFDPDTLELIWTPTYVQAGTWQVQVKATDNGDGTGVPASVTALIPIVVENANRAPEIGDIQNVILDKGAVIEIPVSATDADGNPLQPDLYRQQIAGGDGAQPQRSAGHYRPDAGGGRGGSGLQPSTRPPAIHHQQLSLLRRIVA